MPTICVFAGARGNPDLYPDCAWIAQHLALTGWDIIYGGSSKGVMGAVCAAAKEAGGKVIGVLPEKIYNLGHYDPEIEMLIGKTMAERKQHFWDRSDAFLCLPGSYGTLDELGEVLTLMKLGYLPVKPVIVFNQTIEPSPDDFPQRRGFYDGLKLLFANMEDYGFMGRDRADLVRFTYSKESVLQALNG